MPEDALLQGTIRTVSAKTRKAVVEGIEALAKNLAAAHGCVAEVEMHEGYPVTVNDDTMARRMCATSRPAWSGTPLVRWMDAPVMGAEDFSYVLEEIPGAMAFLGTMPKERGGFVAPNHSNRMVIDEAAMATGVGLYAAAALQFAGATDRKPGA